MPTYRDGDWYLSGLFKIIGAMTLAGGCAIAFSGDRTLAQSNIVPDNTLGTENSFVVPNFNGLPVEAVGGGAVRGQNLFHSFQEFNVSAGRGAYFFSPNATIQNILARVTGTNPSQILGTLGTFGNSSPNLFLINPNGIIFGQNASLDVGGSFVATTANAIRLGNTGLFSASQPQTSNLLAINPNAFFYNQLSNQGQIVNRSTATTTVLGTPTTGLQVPDGRSLLLVGGDVRSEGGRLFAPGGRIELGGVAQNGTLELTTNGNELRLDFPTNVARADVSLTNQAEVNVRAGGGGSIAINARNVEVLGGSKVRAGIASGLGTPQSKAGDIDVNATGTMTVAGELSFLANAVLPGGVGKAGDINITTGSLFAKQGGYFNSSTQGRGDAGSVRIRARDTVYFDGVSSGALSNVTTTAVGNGGDIEITTGSLVVSNGARLNTSTYGQGKAGSVRIRASDSVRFNGGNAVSSVGIGAVGNGGDIEITTGSLSLSNGAQLNTSTLGKGNAGNVAIQAGDTVSFDRSEAFSSAISLFGLLGNGNGSEAKGGNISIEARSLSLINGSRLQANTYGRGDAGNVLIQTSNSISLADNSRILTNVESYARGNGGDITIQTGSLSLTGGSRLEADTSGRGDAGNVLIQASNSISLADNSRILTDVESYARGNGGNITIQTGSLSLTGGSDLQPSTFGRGNAGSVRIVASGSVFLEGVDSDGFSGGVFSNVDKGAIGNNGNINIQAGSLFLSNGAMVSASTSGQGNGGNVTITARENISLDGVGSNEQSSGIFSNVCCKAVGKGGEINIQAGSLSLTNGAEVGTTTFGQGDSGNIAIAVRDTISLDGVGTHGFSSGVFSDVNNKAVGNGGEINIQAGSLSLTNGAAVNASTYGKGNGGNISLDVRDNVSLDGVGSNEFSSRLVTQAGSGAVGKGGSITVRSRSLSLTNNAQLSASAVGFGKPGNIQINAAESVKLKNSSSLSTFNAFGNFLYGADARGNLRIQTGRLIVQDGSDVTVSSSFGDAGNIEVTAHSIELDNKGKLMAQTMLGSGGNITLNVQDLLLLRHNSQISATSTDGTLSLRDALSALGFAILGVDGGNITINAPFIVAVPKENSDITANAFEGRGGRVRITTQGLFGIQPRPRLTPLSDITASSDLGIDGEVTVNGPDVDPSRGLAQLPNDVVDATKQIDRRCTPTSSTQERSRFIITGRGGLPSSPNEPLQAESVVTNWVTLDSGVESNNPPITTTSKSDTPRKLVEAQGWMLNDRGQVVLTAQVPQVTPKGEWLPQPECNPPKTTRTPES